jgi:hypothetical protein
MINMIYMIYMIYMISIIMFEYRNVREPWCE